MKRIVAPPSQIQPFAYFANACTPQRDGWWGQIRVASLWITINPCDLHDLIAQVFAGEKIDPDKFVMTAGPLKDVRARNIARDPYAAAKFFHFTINNIIQTPFGITRGGGIAGSQLVALAYVAVVEERH